MISFLLLLIVPSILSLLIGPPTTLNSTNETTNLLIPGVASCIDGTYGIDLNLNSCINAWVKMPRTLTPAAYGTRSQHLALSFPIRYQSDDGLCVIDLRARHGDAAARGDVARSLDISEAARLIIESCMNPQRRTSGGSLYGFSMSIF